MRPDPLTKYIKFMLSSSPTTRSSRSWHSLPGNFDTLNTRATFETDDELGIAGVAALDVLPATLVNYTARNRLQAPIDGDCVHFFLDDYRFETMWSRPERSLSRVARVGMALTPDFSLYPEMPRMVQMWNVYRSRWCGAWMAHHGVKVVPTVGWSDERSWEYAFRGLHPGGTVAISTVGIMRASVQEKDRFVAGYQAMIDNVSPARVLIYGKRFPGLVDEVEQVYYPPRGFS